MSPWTPPLLLRSTRLGTFYNAVLSTMRRPHMCHREYDSGMQPPRNRYHPVRLRQVPPPTLRLHMQTTQWVRHLHQHMRHPYSQGLLLYRVRLTGCTTQLHREPLQSGWEPHPCRLRQLPPIQPPTRRPNDRQAHSRQTLNGRIHTDPTRLRRRRSPRLTRSQSNTQEHGGTRISHHRPTLHYNARLSHHSHNHTHTLNYPPQHHLTTNTTHEDHQPST